MEKKNNPLVSVFMPAYNQQKYISEAIDSVLEQRLDNVEIVVGDDCSTDETWEIIQSYAEEYPDVISAFRNEKNFGVTANCNEVLRRCRGKYVAFHAGDDVFLPGKLESQLSVFQNDPDCVLCYHDIEVFDSDSGEVIRKWNSGPNGCESKKGQCNEIAAALVRDGTSFMAALSVMVRRDAIPVAGYDWRVPVESDWLMWIDICASNQGTVEFVDRVLARYRKHADSITSARQFETIDKYVTLALVESQYPLLRGEVRSARGYNYYREGVGDILCGRFDRGRWLLIQGARTSVYSWKWVGWWLYSWFRQLSVKS